MWPNPKETADLATFTEEILSGKLHFLCIAKILLCKKSVTGRVSSTAAPTAVPKQLCIELVYDLDH